MLPSSRIGVRAWRVDYQKAWRRIKGTRRVWKNSCFFLSLRARKSFTKRAPRLCHQIKSNQSPKTHSLPAPPGHLQPAPSLPSLQACLGAQRDARLIREDLTPRPLVHPERAVHASAVGGDDSRRVRTARPPQPGRIVGVRRGAPAVV